MESRIQEALRYIDDFPDAKIATVAREFGVPRGRLRYRREGRPPKTDVPAANTKLTEPEEKAICCYIDRLDRINLAVRAEFVTDAANTILRERPSRSAKADPPIVGQRWTSRFLKRHKYHKKRQKKLNSDRQASENVERVNEYFQRLHTVLRQEGIPREHLEYG